MNKQDKVYSFLKNKIVVVYQDEAWITKAKVFTSFTKAHDFQESGGPVRGLLNLKERNKDYILNLVERLYFDQDIDLTVDIVQEYF